MRFCLIAGLLTALSAAVPGFGQTRQVTSVRVDARTGKLVRSVLVAPKAITPSLVEARPATPADPAPALASATPSAAKSNIDELVEQAAQRHAVDPLLVQSVISVESAYNPRAVSHKGAQGLMQLIPETARRFGVTDVFDPAQNIEGGVKYLKFLSELFRNDLRLTLAAYNAGEGAVAKYRYQIPPYPETLNYVYRVGKKYFDARRQSKPAAPTEIAEQKAAPPQREYAPLEEYYDEQGRLVIRTRN